MGDGGNKEEVNDHAIGKEKTATATAADGRPFLGATAGKIGRAYCRRLGGHGSVELLLGTLLGEGGSSSGGVRTFVKPGHGNLVLCISNPSTKHQARGLSSSAGMV
jgi:hypothetical protein